MKFVFCLSGGEFDIAFVKRSSQLLLDDLSLINLMEEILMKNLCFLSMLTLMCVLLFLTGCASKHGTLMKSAQTSYQANQYEAALRDTVAALKLKPDFDKAQDFVVTFFNAAVEVREDKIKALEATPDRFKWDGIVAEYKGLIKINNLVKNLPPTALVHKKTKQRIIFDTKDYTSQLSEASKQAAEVHYQEGIRIAASSDDVDTQKKAAKEFKKAEEFIPGYKDANVLYERSRRAGVKKMAILPFEDKSGKARSYGALSETITDQIIDSVVNDPSATEFLELVSRDQLERVMQEQRLGLTGLIDEQTAANLGKVLGVHEMVIGKITQIVYVPERTRDSRVAQKGTIRVQEGTETYTDSKGNVKERAKYVRKNVSARVTHYTRESSASIIGSYQIIDVQTAAIRGSGRFNEKSEFKVQWGTFTGQEAALDKFYRNLCSATEQFSPTEQELVLDVSNKLSSQLAEKFKEYAR